ncbi:hypothetical protein A2V80_02370 [Candidatus Woesebacteria bacterium RBG_16_39_8b]|uniref:Homing endonuclease LAGLIDADG domain-containing protein n=1 Tax=Candidatus Woesebacteria bacterium RBG_16_39_8b TaxID=1802482 RepID=A0A1F7X8I2_9BACT|nr:MAG: hypothetical protein A2V80_02370 [Candidatus Woesebacteria bacterium RBG_16_39_8b]
MGSFNLKTARDYYCLGLWLADGYWRSSSVGLSSTNDHLHSIFIPFLKKMCPTHIIKEHVYFPNTGEKRRLKARHVYVNSRPFTRYMMNFKKIPHLKISNKFLPAYFAGRIDGDGHVDSIHRSGVRIAYSNKEDAIRDMDLLKKLDEEPASLYRYEQANTWVIYLRKKFLDKIKPSMARYSLKLSGKINNPVETDVTFGD